MYDELRQMKSDYEYLKADMDRQMIVNSQLLETIFRNNVSVLDSNRRTSIVSVSTAILVILTVSYIRGLDMRLAGMIAVCYAFMLIGYILIYHKLGKIEQGNDNVLSTMTRLRNFKRNYMIVNAISWGLVAVLMCFIFPEILDTYLSHERGIAAIAFMCLAVIAGICIQYFIDRKVLKACDDIIDRLEDRP